MKKIFAKLFAHTPKAKNLEWKNVQSVLIRPIGAGLGDAVVLSAVFSQLKKAYPTIKLGVLSTPRNRPIFERIFTIDEILPDTFFTAITHRCKYQVFLDYQPTFTTRNILFDFLLFPSYAICFEKKAKKYYNADTVRNYNFYVPDLSATHLSRSLALTPFASYVDTQTPTYSLTKPSQEALNKIKKFLQGNKCNILVSPLGSDKILNKEILSSVLKKLNQHITPHFVFPLSNDAYSVNVNNSTYTGKISLEEFLSLIWSADLIISVDTVTVHIACAYQKPLVAIYGGWDYGFAQFAPIGNKAFSVRSHTPANGPVKHIDNWAAEEAFEKAVKLLEGK